MIELWRGLRDPRVSTTIALAALVIVGFALVAQSYRGVAGVALVGAGVALLNVHLDRTEAAQERRQLAELQREALRLLALASPQRLHTDETQQRHSR